MQSHSVFIECANCHHVYHVKCINADRDDFISNAPWYCIYCLQTILPFNHIEDSQEFLLSDHGMCFRSSLSVSWNERQGVHSLRKLMKVPTLHSLKWIQISSFIQAHIMPWTHDAIILLKTHSWQISLEKVSIRTNYHYLYPPLHHSWKGVYCYHLVRLWTESCPLCIFNNTHRIHYIFAHPIKQVCRVKCPFQNSKIWNFGQFFKFVTLTLSSFDWLGIQYESMV